MNEVFSVILDFDSYSQENEEIINRMDKVIESQGWEYTGICNMYRPIDSRTRDETIYHVMHALEKTKWLKPYNPRVLMGNMIDVMEMENIDVSGMTAPLKEKLKKYEEYYNLTKSLPHAIIVDENGKIRDGYISYLLAWKYSEKAEILSTWSDQPVKKVVAGKHVEWDGEHFIHAKAPIICRYLKLDILPEKRHAPDIER